MVDQANVDGRRRLVLIRRDDIEHLIMTGGPVDVVIETGIGHKPARSVAELSEVTPAQSTPAPAAVFSRPARAFGQVVGEK